MSSAPKIERYEQRGFFLHIPFPGEENPTVLYVADRDFENLHEIVDDDEKDWTDFRDEVQELLDHSGHEGDHEFSESLTHSLMDVIQEEDLPDETEIEDPLEDLTSDQSAE
jgi:DNA-binding ferritin-like protein